MVCLLDTKITIMIVPVTIGKVWEEGIPLDLTGHFISIVVLAGVAGQHKKLSHVALQNSPVIDVEH